MERHALRVGARLPGDVVECGVWKGGSSMLAARALLGVGDTARTLWLYDTFAGMAGPTERDVDHSGHDARARFQRAERLRFVAGKVEHTIPPEAPERIALLRLDTDWYESTRHELEHLSPRLVPGGVLLIDVRRRVRASGSSCHRPSTPAAGTECDKGGKEAQAVIDPVAASNRLVRYARPSREITGACSTSKFPANRDTQSPRP